MRSPFAQRKLQSRPSKLDCLGTIPMRLAINTAVLSLLTRQSIPLVTASWPTK